MEKEKAVETLADKLVQQEDIHRQRIVDLHVQLQQEKYINRTLSSRHRKTPVRSSSNKK